MSALGLFDKRPETTHTLYMRIFWMIRHGETDWNSLYRRLQGHTDIALNEKGLWQAKTMGKLIHQQHAKQYKLDNIQFVSSDLTRAKQTARLISQQLDTLVGLNYAEIETDSKLREVLLGDAEGLTYEQVDAKWGHDFREKWGSNEARFENLFYPNGESRKQVRERVTSSIFDKLEAHPRRHLVFVSHGFAIRSVVYHTSNIQVPFFVPNCALVPFAYDNKQIRYIGADSPEQLLYPKF